MSRTIHRTAFTLVELLVAIGIVLLLIGMTVQAARESARRMACLNNMRQLGLSCHLFHDIHQNLPSGQHSYAGSKPYFSWLGETLPYIEQNAMAIQITEAYKLSSNPFQNSVHAHFDTPVTTFSCPSDGRAEYPQLSRGYDVALTNYVGVSGVSGIDQKGCLYVDSQTRLADITDGLTNTLIIGERPPSPDMFFGWWYGGFATPETGAYDCTLGIQGLNLTSPGDLWAACDEPFYKFSASDLYDECGALHFWSLHPGGANFVLADGSVRFFTYHAADVMVYMSTISDADVPRQEL